MKTFWDKISHKIINKWIIKQDKNGDKILLYITGMPISYYSNRYYPGYYCNINKGSRFDYKSIKELYQTDKESTHENMVVKSLQEILDCSELKDHDLKLKLDAYFSKKLLTI